MSFTNKFPYTDFHELNLDWILERYKELTDDVEALKLRVSKNEEDIAEIKADLLNIREEIEAFKREVNERIDAFEAEVHEMFDQLEADLRQELQAFEAQIEAELREMEERLEVKFEALKQLVTDTLQAFRDELTQTEEELRTELAQAVADMNRALETGLSEIRSEMEAFKEIIDNTLSLFDQKIADNLEIAKAYTDEREAVLQAEIDEIRIDPTPRVIIPATQDAGTIQESFDTEHHYLRSWALRADYYDSLSLTAAEYDAENLIAYDYDYLSKWFLVEKKDVGYMYSPFNGRFERIRTVIEEIADNFRGFINAALTAAAYDAVEITASDYDNLEITAFNYDYYGQNYVVI